ncbi:3-keto-disaccharide hydrolase [Sunxiuqinia sp. A32]|uniref:3-keto-disaccharide hydrolase n=1 Tax=Sunxiuqinia sp. A32 TaxID=3461496 RepID=UPI0040453CDE
MKSLTFIILVAFSVLLVSCQKSSDWEELFNGKDLTGWTQLNGKAKYEVINGEIVGTTVANTPNSFLRTEKTYGDFIFEVELLVDNEMNSGIQFRSLSSEDFQNGRVHGYQCEVDPSERAWSGGIYDEARRGWLYPLEQNPEGRKAFKRGEWNHYRIEAIGNSLRTWVNGVPCADLIDDMTAEGFIALQVHGIGDSSEAGSQIKWRNIRIKTENLEQSSWTDIPVVNLIPNYLSPQEKAQGWTMLFDGKTTEGWRGVGKEEFPSKGWKVSDGELIVEPADGAESGNGGDIVTMDEYSTFELKLDFKITDGANSGIKYYITEKYGSDMSAIGLEYQILDDELHPDAKMGTAGNRTVASLYDLIPAHKNKIVNKPGRWNQARLIVEGTRHEEWLRGNNIESNDFVGAHVEHWLNNRKVLEYERGTQAFYALVARSKYAVWEDFGSWQSGHILLQDHGNEVHFRSIKIRKLD